MLADPLGSDKVWYFYQGPSDWRMGLVSIYQERNWAPTLVYRRVQELTWTQDAAGNPYIASKLTKLDPGTAYEVQTKTEQTLDIYGNLTQLQQYGHNQLSTPARTYNNTYLTGTNYTSRRIRNRLTLSQVTSGGQTTTLVQNFYDQYGQQLACGPNILTDRTNLRQHDTANYGTSFYWRGNLTFTMSLGGPRCMNYDIAGTTLSLADPSSHSSTATYTSATNYAAPSQVTTNSLSRTSSTGKDMPVPRASRTRRR